MCHVYRTCLFVLLTALAARAAEGPVDRDGRPLIKKLGTIAVDVVENSPVVFKDKLYNTSICRADDKYVMMFEIGAPKEETGSAFTARFATSKNLKHWTVTPPECNYSKDRYTAPHALRWLDGYYYDFYLESVHGKPYESRGYEMYVVRSKDLVHWEMSPLNPVLRASAEDRKPANPDFTDEQRRRIATAKNLNNSDVDFCEYRGRVIIVYSWGNQRGVEHLAEAVYEATLEQFLQGWFPEKKPRKEG